MSALGEWDTDEVDDELAEPDPADAAPDFDDDEQPPSAIHVAPPLIYQTVEQFVCDYLAPLYRRSTQGNDVAWCPQWWRHAEAIVRLEALWRAWEHLRQDPALGMSAWLRDHADPHMAVLLSEHGPFAKCHDGHSDRLPALPVEPAPNGLFDPSL